MSAPIPNFSDVLLYLPFNGANGSTTFTDRSDAPLAVSAFGTAAHSSVRSKGYATSLYLPGSGGSYLHVNPLCAKLAPLSSFTIEAWFYQQSAIGAQDTMFGFHGPTGNTNKMVVADGIFYGDATNIPTTTGFTKAAVGTWFHMAALRTPTHWTFYKDGALLASLAAGGANNIGATDRFSIGQEWDTNATTPTDLWHGNVQDLIVTNGAKYTAAFTPPARALGEIIGTVLDDTEAPTQRRVTALTRDARAWLRTTLSDPTTGAYTIGDLLAGHPHAVLAFDDDAGLVHHDLMLRVVPE